MAEVCFADTVKPLSPEASAAIVGKTGESTLSGEHAYVLSEITSAAPRQSSSDRTERFALQRCRREGTSNCQLPGWKLL